MAVLIATSLLTDLWTHGEPHRPDKATPACNSMWPDLGGEGSYSQTKLMHQLCTTHPAYRSKMLGAIVSGPL